MRTVFLSHPRSARALYFGDRAIAALQAIAGVRFNPGDTELPCDALAALAQDCDVIISYRQTPADDALLAALPRLLAFARCAIDIRNIDVPAASRHGVLVTQASAGFTAAVSEWIVGAMIDLSRHISACTVLYHAGQPAPARMGRELRGATLGVIGYGQISRYLCDVALALGMRIVVSDPYTSTGRPELAQVGLDELLRQADYVVCLAGATPATENMMDGQAFAAMQPGARPDAVRPPVGASARHCHAAHRRPDAAGHRAPGDGNRRPGGRAATGARSPGRGQCAAGPSLATGVRRVPARLIVCLVRTGSCGPWATKPVPAPWCVFQ